MITNMFLGPIGDTLYHENTWNLGPYWNVDNFLSPYSTFQNHTGDAYLHRKSCGTKRGGATTLARRGVQYGTRNFRKALYSKRGPNRLGGHN